MSEDDDAPAGATENAAGPADENPEPASQPRKSARRPRKEAAPEADASPDEGGGDKDEAPAEAGGGGARGRGRRSSGGRTRKKAGSAAKGLPIDAEELAGKAWELYRADIAEEGIALVGNDEGKKLAARSFELAKIFLEEKARRAPKED